MCGCGSGFAPDLYGAVVGGGSEDRAVFGVCLVFDVLGMKFGVMRSNKGGEADPRHAPDCAFMSALLY